MVMKKHIMITILFPMAMFASWENHQVFETSMVQALANKETLVSTVFTNQLTQFISSSTNMNDRATANLILSISTMELFENTLDNTMYSQSYNFATNVFSIVGLTSNSWQKLCANLLLSSCDAMDGKDISAFNITTNSLQIIAQYGYSDPTNKVLSAILNFHDTPDLTLKQTFSLCAGLFMAKIKNTTEARAFVNGLPFRYRNEIEDIINEDD